MSVEASLVTNEGWTRWQGHLVHDAFPVGRCLGHSDHSGVYLTKPAPPGSPEAAIKLVPADRGLAETLLPRWKRARSISHPHLLGLLQLGGCQLDGLPFLYVVMEYADQTLARLLQHRALTDGEAREMLAPILDALALLHGYNLVHGRLKPTNILVVGDQLKLASDCIRRVTDSAMGGKALTPYDAPEARHGGSSTAGDIWALGACLFEALTRRTLPVQADPGEPVWLPADFSPSFRDIVTRCLNPNPRDRPGVTELIAWAGGDPPRSPPDPNIQAAAVVPPGPAAHDAQGPTPSILPSANPRVPRALLLGVVVLLVLAWSGLHWSGPRGTAALPSAPAGPPSQAKIAAEAMTPDARKPVTAVAPPVPTRGEPGSSPPALHAAIPAPSPGARRTIIGHIKVWVRVIVDPDGSVFAATVDRPGPSRYFQRLSLEAAKKWTFPAIDTSSKRVMQIRFDFSRGGTTGKAIALH